jgi:hypothetical protein
MRTTAWTIVGVLLLGAGVAGCGGKDEEPEAAARGRDKRGATPQETVALVKEALERRRYRDVLLHVMEDDRRLFVVSRFQALVAYAEGLGDDEATRKRGLLAGLGDLARAHGLDEEQLRIGHGSALGEVDPGAILDGLGALAARNAVDGLGGFADLVPELRDWQIEKDEASAITGEEPATERFTFRRVGGAWYYVAWE